ncbi:MAG: hypothetical protein O9331_16105 [Acidovorax sp.]|jgi:hypothetical protein|nr:hypothetical protein [Limnobacter sp.]MCZ8017177.1 hypothetical protein [Limnobacter sp.]MCZ8095002.1 hypothetical protein [Acidovorax sp.]MCZ8227676.1 hypothetical protein [Burkholderiaceae bacterium]MCZ8265198.1 hypothetical protein [Novosphingobium sp.]
MEDQLYTIAEFIGALISGILFCAFFAYPISLMARDKLRVRIITARVLGFGMLFLSIIIGISDPEPESPPFIFLFAVLMDLMGYDAAKFVIYLLQGLLALLGSHLFVLFVRRRATKKNKTA